MHIMFVCTGNICRSPMAERLARVLSEQARLQNCSFSSSGVRAVVGHPIHQEATRFLEARGADATKFAARRFSPKLAAGADLIVTMTVKQRATVLELAPARLRTCYTLTEVASLVDEHGAQTIEDLSAKRSLCKTGAWQDVRDPIGEDASVFAAVGGEIADALPALLQVCR